MASSWQLLSGHIFAGALSPQSTEEPDEQYHGEVCIANIGPKERRQRLTFGVITITLGFGLALLLATHVPELWRLLLFVTFYAGATGIFQWWEKT